jgi:hypothetical protein
MTPGYVVSDSGAILIIVPDITPSGFSLADENKVYENGEGISGWQRIENDDHRITEELRDTMEWLRDTVAFGDPESWD